MEIAAEPTVRNCRETKLAFSFSLGEDHQLSQITLLPFDDSFPKDTMWCSPGFSPAPPFASCVSYWMARHWISPSPSRSWHTWTHSGDDSGRKENPHNQPGGVRQTGLQPLISWNGGRQHHPCNICVMVEAITDG